MTPLSDNEPQGGLLKLAERCEQATGPDVILERDIAVALGWRHLPNKGPERDEYPFCWVGLDGAPDFDGFPDYLHSLDAAMTLVPDLNEWRPLLDATDSGEGNFYVELFPGDDRPIAKGHARSLPLALCAAALRARSQS